MQPAWPYLIIKTNYFTYIWSLDALPMMTSDWHTDYSLVFR